MAISRQQQRENSSLKMLNAACEEFALKGYSGTKIADIASRAEVAVGLVSQRFGSKEELYRQALQQICKSCSYILYDDD
ncbi:MAG: TetR/AcrR family transcriptional regulator, partial [Clostridia bacterium]|nr:TetR/AcrR family transcriptional regulator [Clostridia bacterium]